MWLELERKEREMAAGFSGAIWEREIESLHFKDLKPKNILRWKQVKVGKIGKA